MHELISTVQQLGNPRIAVVGDYMIDRYIIGDAERISPEAPVPVVHASGEEDRLGGAGNVAANLIGLGASVSCFGVHGNDSSGRQLQTALAELGAHVEGMVECSQRPTIQKIRVMARNQQMLRVDREDSCPLSAEIENQLKQQLFADSWDALILSDYGKGCLGEKFTQEIIAEANRRGVPSLVDPKHQDLSRYARATMVTPNRHEAELAAGHVLPDLQAVEEAGRELCSQAQLGSLLITLGAEGMYLIGADRVATHIPTSARQVYDVTGAGDTVISALALCLASDCQPELAMQIANAAAGIAVSKVGTTVVGRTELLRNLRSETPAGKVIDQHDPQLAAVIEHFRLEGRRVVFTNGCFDILHAGHVRYLRAARGLGDALVLGLNTDESVSRLKGPDRPFNQLDDRAEVLAALECIDLVVPFSDDTPESLVQQLAPDVLVKGADYKDKGVAGAEFVKKNGGEVEFIDMLPGRSTSNIADRIRDTK
ncbi:MAG: bifunctional D-glycero-beta-D-manno-heptose-7-phosphate kinase/D-glycero-beta-D-manno-heptose 1-phosphate adenylyltransferase HldE [Planctomycetota bacterium]|nr:bifunctional D-glycero-beta-D-manno-heptose-7-phosphate kinase/D-glycero-beta-D-manno-heptose 1-phosphate adenylyltransferase HldE [Planctomycetota bacterium]